MVIRFKPCAVADCPANSHHDGNGRKGWCCAHYQRWQKNGDPLIVGSVPSPAIDWLREHVSHIGEDCLTWPFAVSSKDGYGRVHHPDDGRLMTASRLMCLLVHGEPPTPQHEGAHTCGRGSSACVNPGHLYWATPSKNQADRVDHGTSNRGERQGRSKLTEVDVRAIRGMLGSMTQGSIADLFGVEVSTISRISTGDVWGWLN
jgi:hypothetical protein